MTDPWYFQRSNTPVRSIIKRQPSLYRLVRTLRLAILLGPFRNVAIKYYRWRDSNPPLPTEEKTVFPDLTVENSVAAIRKDGLATGLTVPPELIEEIRQYCASHPARIRIDKMYHIDFEPIDAPTEGVRTFRYMSPHKQCNAVRKLAFDPMLVEIAARYFGVIPVMYDTEIYWSFPSVEGGANGQSQPMNEPFHYEAGDFMSIVVFIYLSDVDTQCGPHVMIQGTHKRKTLRQLLTNHISAEKAVTMYGNRIEAILGPRGTGFFEDLSGYHHRSTGCKPRLILGIHYTMHRDS